MTVLTNKHSYQFDLKSLPAIVRQYLLAQFVIRADGNKAAPFMSAAPQAPMPAIPALPASLLPFAVGPSVSESGANCCPCARPSLYAADSAAASPQLQLHLLRVR